MKVLFIGPVNSPLIDFLKIEDEVLAVEEPLDNEFLNREKPDFLISYGYRHIIKKEILSRYIGRAINLHISLLPWNRGADPNFWSFIDNTPKGVTIHYLDEGIDTGDVIAQAEVPIMPQDTLKTSYERLQENIRRLFIENWVAIKNGKCERKKQGKGGTYHRLKDKEPLLYLLVNGWDTPVSYLINYYEQKKMREQ